MANKHKSWKSGASAGWPNSAQAAVESVAEKPTDSNGCARSVGSAGAIPAVSGSRVRAAVLRHCPA
jgi:hypothetical protein